MRGDDDLGRVGVCLPATDELVDLSNDPAAHGAAADFVETVQHDEAGDSLEDVLHRLRVGGDSAALVRHQVGEEALDGRVLALA